MGSQSGKDGDETPASESSMGPANLLCLKDGIWSSRLFLNLKIYFYGTGKTVQLVSIDYEDLKTQHVGGGDREILGLIV